jgi:transposase
MERFRNYEPNQQVFVTIDPLETFGPDSFEIFLVTIINKLNVSMFWPHQDRGGESPYNPCAMLGIILYGFCRGIFTSRKLEKACRNDLGFMYVSGHNTPDHAAICRFLQRHRDILNETFRQIVYLAYKKGFIDYKTLALDGTKIRANASKVFTGTLADFRKRLGSIEQSIEKAINRLESDSELDSVKSEIKINEAIREQERISEFLSNSTEILNLKGKEKKQNITDPDCRIMLFPDGTIHEAYNAQACVDSVAGLIVATDVSQAENDRKLLTPMLTEVVQPEESNVMPGKVLADAGYWDPQELTKAVEDGYEVYVPSPSNAYPFSSGKKKDKWEMSNFETGDSGVFGTCPGGQRIKARDKLRVYSNKDKGGPYYIFRLTKNQYCSKCKVKDQCWRTSKNFRIVVVTVSKVDHYQLTKELEQQLMSSEGKKIYSRRMPLIERTFAEIKANLGFRRFMRRYKESVQMEWTLVCMAFNLRRMYVLQQE